MSFRRILLGKLTGNDSVPSNIIRISFRQSELGSFKIQYRVYYSDPLTDLHNGGYCNFTYDFPNTGVIYLVFSSQVGTSGSYIDARISSGSCESFYKEPYYTGSGSSKRHIVACSITGPSPTMTISLDYYQGS